MRQMEADEESERRRGEEGRPEGRTIRVFHSLGKTGGTVVSRCLGCMEKVALLSEIHPQGPAMFAPLFADQPELSRKWDPLVQAREWFDWFDDEGAGSAGEMGFSEAIGRIEAQAAAHGKELVIRDWSHPDFIGAPFRDRPTGESETVKALAGGFRILRAAIVRHPVDHWLSKRKLPWMRERLTLERFMEGYLAFAKLCRGIPTIRFEDFTKVPQASVWFLCEALELSYDADFIGKWWEFDKLTGDLNSERGGSVIGPRPRRAHEEELIDAFREIDGYRESLALLGYEDE